ncbi:MAG: hypothetical protein LKF36_12860 [Lactobacillus sp.]|jgi:DNA-binding ferritin-like protein|nr:hypothetical protein [Lactobacillus sp.]
MDKETIATLFEKEQTKSEQDHHTPTVGAMITHVLANLKFQSFKLEQYGWYAAGHNELFQSIYAANQKSYFTVAEKMLDNGELVPTTVAEMQDYTFLEESGGNKYWPVADMLKDTVLDFKKSQRFINLAIQLAQKQNNPVLEMAMVQLLSQNQHMIYKVEQVLGYPVPLEDED